MLFRSVPAQDGHAIAVPHFEGHEKGDSLDAVVSAVHVVTHEEVVGVRAVAADAEELREVVLLALRALS